MRILKRRVFICSTVEPSCRKRFQTEEEREKHQQIMRQVEERRRAAMLRKKSRNQKVRKEQADTPGVQVVLSQIQQIKTG